MNRRKLALDPKLAEFCKAEMTVGEPEAIEATVQKPDDFKVTDAGVIPTEEILAHKKMRAAAPLAAGALDVAITHIECVSADGDTLPAEFQLRYRFHLSNFSDTDVAEVPVTIYFNPTGTALVEQGTTMITDIKAGHYQLVEFAFPPVEAGSWVMTLEANKPRTLVESNYANNAMSKTFVYTDQVELMAESVSALEVQEGNILYYDVETTLDFYLKNIGSAVANNVLVQVPAAFEDATGAYPAMLAETRMDIPAHTRRRLQLHITFTKPATAQIGLLLNNDRACPELSYTNNEVSTTFNIVKYNPSVGGEIVVTGMPACSYYAGGKEYFHPDSGMVAGDWNKDNDGENILNAIKTFYKAVFGEETDNTEKYAYSLYGSRTVTSDNFNGTYHLGVDVNLKKGCDVKSAHSGEILSVNEEKGRIAIYDSEKDVTYFYLHSEIDAAIKEKVGMQITKGTLLGKESNKGLGGSNNYHLHFEVQNGRSTAPGNPSKELDNKLPTLSPYQYMNV